MAVLITGLGYLGVPLALHLLWQGQQVVGLENFFSTSPRHLRPLKSFSSFELLQGSISSRRALEETFSRQAIDVLYHLAAQPSAHPSAAPASYTERTNLLAPRLVFQAARRHGVRTIVLASSFRVYGDRLAGRVTEEQPYGAMSDLAHLTKIYTEKLLEMETLQGPTAGVAVRLGVVYGLGPAMKADPRFLTVPNLFSMRAIRGERIEVHPNAVSPVGFVHLEDAVSALTLAPAIARGGYQAVNAVTEVLAVAEVARLVQQRAALRGLNVQVFPPETTTEPTRYAVDSSLGQAGFQARRNMADSLDELLDYFARAGSKRPAPGSDPPSAHDAEPARR